MLEGRNLYYRYGKKTPWVLKNANLQVNEGEVVGLFGYSGQGKTTLARILGGYIPPVSGEVRLDGRGLPDRGYCPVQVISQNPETAFNPRWRLSASLNEAGPLPKESLRHFQVAGEWLDRRPFELSGGELQRLAIARMLRPETRFLLADETTTMLDALTQARIWQMLLTYVEQYGLGVLVISHDKRLLERVCDRIERIDSIRREE